MKDYLFGQMEHNRNVDPMLAYGNDIKAVTTVISAVGAGQGELFVPYAADGGSIYAFATVNDNATGDGIHVPSQPQS